LAKFYNDDSINVIYKYLENAWIMRCSYGK